MYKKIKALTWLRTQIFFAYVRLAAFWPPLFVQYDFK